MLPKPLQNIIISYFPDEPTIDHRRKMKQVMKEIGKKQYSNTTFIIIESLLISWLIILLSIPGRYLTPDWVDVMRWVNVALTVIFIPIIFIFNTRLNKYYKRERIREEITRKLNFIEFESVLESKHREMMRNNWVEEKMNFSR